MKKFNLLLFIVLLSFNVFSQVKINSDEPTKTVQYECLFPKDFIFTSKDEKGYNVTKNFTVEAATLIYKANELVGFTLKSNSGAQVTYPIAKIISEFPGVKQFWIDRSERYFVRLAFLVDIDNGINITFISNIDGCIMFEFLFQRILTEKERKEKENLKIQKEIKDPKQIEIFLSQIDIEAEKKRIENEIEEYYKSVLKDKMINQSVQELLGIGNLYTTNVSIRGKFILQIDALKKIHIIKKDVDCILSDYIVISDDKDRFFNKQLLELRNTYADEYEINGQTYYKFKMSIFTDDCKIDKNFDIETNVLGVNLKNGKFKYHSDKNVIPKIVENWCSENIKTNGLYFINYMMIDGEFVCRILNFDRETKEYLKQRFKIGLLNKY